MKRLIRSSKSPVVASDNPVLSNVCTKNDVDKQHASCIFSRLYRNQLGHRMNSKHLSANLAFGIYTKRYHLSDCFCYRTNARERQTHTHTRSRFYVSEYCEAIPYERCSGDTHTLYYYKAVKISGSEDSYMTT